RQGAAHRDEGLVLDRLDVPRAGDAGLVTNEVRTRVTQPGTFGQRGAMTSREALVLLPLELLRYEHMERHTGSNDRAPATFPGSLDSMTRGLISSGSAPVAPAHNGRSFPSNSTPRGRWR